MCQDLLEKVPVVEEQEYHMPKKLWDKGEAFMILKKVHFQKNGGIGYYSVTTDGTYLYIYISAINGGMYKVGTGYNSSIAGKIYLEREIHSQVNAKSDEINWVYFKGKIYLRVSSKDPFIIDVINTDTFKTESNIELNCQPLFGHQALINLNRNSQMLTDGHKLYFLGKQLKITRARDCERKQEKDKTASEREEQLKNKRKKGSKKQKVQPADESNEQPSPTEAGEKIVQFVLYEFDISKERKDEAYDCDETLAQELYVSFNNYFTIEECRRSLDLCLNDISEATQWLVDQGEK